MLQRREDKTREEKRKRIGEKLALYVMFSSDMDLLSYTYLLLHSEGAGSYTAPRIRKRKQYLRDNVVRQVPDDIDTSAAVFRYLRPVHGEDVLMNHI